MKEKKNRNNKKNDYIWKRELKKRNEREIKEIRERKEFFTAHPWSSTNTFTKGLHIHVGWPGRMENTSKPQATLNKPIKNNL